jgi:hypothetical protein
MAQGGDPNTKTGATGTPGEGDPGYYIPDEYGRDDHRNHFAGTLAGRALLRIYFRLVGRSRPGWRNRILIVGAGALGQRAAEVLIDRSRWGYSLIGFLDDDPAKPG